MYTISRGCLGELGPGVKRRNCTILVRERIIWSPLDMLLFVDHLSVNYFQVCSCTLRMQPLNLNAIPAERKTPCFPFVTSGPILILKMSMLCCFAGCTRQQAWWRSIVCAAKTYALPLVAASSNSPALQPRVPLLPQVVATHSRPNLF